MYERFLFISKPGDGHFFKFLYLLIYETTNEILIFFLLKLNLLKVGCQVHKGILRFLGKKNKQTNKHTHYEYKNMHFIYRYVLSLIFCICFFMRIHLDHRNLHYLRAFFSYYTFGNCD